LPQALGIVDGSYKRVIPFRQLEFRNAFLEWVIMDNIKYRKAASKRLQRAFRITNAEASKALPTLPSIVAAWIHDIFVYFEPKIIEEIRTAKSRITISFDGWGLKRKRLSVVGVVVHFINAKNQNVTRLIGLPMLPGHRKSSVSMYNPLFSLYYN
jgi:hypothetical protein